MLARNSLLARLAASASFFNASVSASFRRITSVCCFTLRRSTNTHTEMETITSDIQASKSSVRLDVHHGAACSNLISAGDRSNREKLRGGIGFVSLNGSIVHTPVSRTIESLSKDGRTWL